MSFGPFKVLQHSVDSRWVNNIITEYKSSQSDMYDIFVAWGCFVDFGHSSLGISIHTLQPRLANFTL